MRKLKLNRPATNSPVREALEKGSFLLDDVKDGLNAIIRDHKHYFHEGIKSEFDDSIDIDASFKLGREQENRWDYLIGHRARGAVIAVEPHSAYTSEIETVIKKKKSASKLYLH